MGRTRKSVLLGLLLVGLATPAAAAPAEVTVLPGGAESALIAARDPSWLDPGRYRDRMLPVPRWERPWRALPPPLPPFVEAPPRAGEESWVGALPPLAEPIDVPAGENRLIWVDLFVPAATPAGDYQGTLTIHSDASESLPGPTSCLSVSRPFLMRASRACSDG